MAKNYELGQHLVTCEGITYCMEGISTVEQATERIAALLGLPVSNQLNWRAEQNGKLLSLSSGLSPSPLLLVPSPGLRGGKGGLGSQLKAIGIKMDGSKNTESMRDLDGRRQRDVHNLQKLKEYVTETRPERERLKKEKEEKKLAHLKWIAQGRKSAKHTFWDPEYDRARSEVEGKVHDAMDAALSTGGERTLLEVLEKQILGARKMVKGAFMMQDMEGISDSSDEEEPLE